MIPNNMYTVYCIPYTVYQIMGILGDDLNKNNNLKLTSLHLNALYEVSQYDYVDENYEIVVGILKNLRSVSIYGTKLSYLEKSNLTR